jgi:hypothetical protein
LFHPFGFGFEQILANFWVFPRQADEAWRQMRYLRDEYSTRVFGAAKKNRVIRALAIGLSRRYNVVIKSRIIKGLRSFASDASTAGDEPLPGKPVTLSPFREQRFRNVLSPHTSRQ